MTRPAWIPALQRRGPGRGLRSTRDRTLQATEHRGLLGVAQHHSLRRVWTFVAGTAAQGRGLQTLTARHPVAHGHPAKGAQCAESMSRVMPPLRLDRIMCHN